MRTFVLAVVVGAARAWEPLKLAMGVLTDDVRCVFETAPRWRKRTIWIYF